jgi:hypothetical protein
MRRMAAVAVLVGIVGVSGCKSAYVGATVRNETGGPVSLLEVDYPSASFGKESLGTGGSYSYRFKVLGSGATKVSWTDAERKEHAATGPALREGQHGQLMITLTPGGAQWAPELSQ